MNIDVNIKSCGKNYVIIEFLSDEGVRWADNFVDLNHAEFIDGCLKLHKKYLDIFFMNVESCKLVIASEEEDIMSHSSELVEV